MKAFLSLVFGLFVINCFGQTFSTDPAFPTADASLTLTVDASGTSLEGHGGDVWIWAWLPDCSSDCDAPTNVDPATAAEDDAKMTRSGSDPDVYSITFTPTTFFDKSDEEITQIGFKLKSEAWSDNLQTDVDLFFDLSEGGELNVAFTSPVGEYLFVDNADEISFEVASSLSADLSLTIDGAEVASTTGKSLSYTHTVVETGTIEVVIIADDGETVKTDNLYFIVRETTPSVSLPAGIIKGINYDASATKATLALEAPGKSSVYVIGEFNDWVPSSAYQMNQDGDIFWLEITGLTAGQEYAFQYLVDESIVVADPYADKVLDPDNDAFIPASTYPSLKTYPEEASGIVAVLQTNQTPYDWQVTDFEKPAKEELVIYELLVRDFDEKQNYQGIIDHLDYLESLGINAIQLMPIMEFDGNLSWGYNPSFFFASDKYYGSKSDLKAFIDECHSRGMAVILDMVLNHTHEDSPLAQLYWDESEFKPAADNPWLNQEARHPFNVFYDFNHESSYTQALVDTVNHYWLEEYKFDGYRFDLTKGFTQDFTASSDVGAWSNYNQTRIDLLTRMVDEIWIDHPDAYVIFEHLAANSEEKVLADYGIMLWGNMNYNFNQLTMGHTDQSSVDWAYYATRDWADPNLIAYMESHDEERLVYRNQESGNTSNGGHNTKDLKVALERVKAASSIYYGIPGPKMIWQFGELGYDQSIDLNGRTGEKPIPWTIADDGLNYDEDDDRLRLKKVTSLIIDLKTSYAVFNTSDFTLDESQSLVKQIILKNEPYTDSPSGTSEMNVVIVANFNVNNTEVDIDFPHDGIWYHYLANGDELDVSGGQSTINFGPGEFRIYSDVQLGTVEEELTFYVQPTAPSNLTVAESANEGVVLTWEDNSTIETSYKVYRAENDGNFELLETIASSSTQYIDETATANMIYTYKVEAANKHYSTSSNESEITTTDIITSLESNDSRIGKVFPNPTKGKLEIDGYENAEISIYNLSGEKLIERSVSGKSNIDIEDFPAGTYLIKVISDTETFTSRVIKLND